MNILIGTPIHKVKDYSMERWLQNVSQLQQKSPADLLIVDNSIGTDYLKKVERYCKKNGVKNYTLKHIELDPLMHPYERIEWSEEWIRQEFLSKGYGALLSWECDQIIPANALKKMVQVMTKGPFAVVSCNTWARKNPTETNTDLGFVLIKRECLEKVAFIKDNKRILGEEAWFRDRVLKNGFNYVAIYGVITPVYHLDG